jgi:protein SCO1/2
MKNFSYIGLIIILIVFGLLFIPKIVDRVANNTQVESNRSVPAKPLAYIKLNGEAKKVPEFLMRNQDSLLIGNEDFRGKVYLAEFFFTRCPTICPIMNKNMKILDDRFGDRQDFGIASFTIDPDNDKPHVLKKYAEDYGVKSQNWHFLTDKKSVVYELANSGFSIFAGINPAVAGGFEHQGRVYVSFIIGVDGRVIMVQPRGPDKNLEKEARRIIENLPQMIPGKQRGKAVRVPYSIPITFKLQ